MCGILELLYRNSYLFFTVTPFEQRDETGAAMAQAIAVQVIGHGNQVEGVLSPLRLLCWLWQQQPRRRQRQQQKQQEQQEQEQTVVVFWYILLVFDFSCFC